jgi:hypothetical protein
MSPTVKYTLGRIGLFLLVLLVLWPVHLNVLLKLMIALVFSAALSFFLLRGWRDQMAGRLATVAERRRAERDRLRSALAGEDQQGTPGERDESEGDRPKS